MQRRPIRPLLAAVAAAVLLTAAPAASQYSTFGKNKIQYDDFDWEVLSSEHVDLYYYPEERELALIALEYAEESFDALSQKFSYVPRDRIPMVVFASHQHFEQTNIVPFFLPEGVAGFTEFLKGRVALPFNGSYADFRHVIRHELVHVFQARKGAHLKRLHPGGYEWNSPLWFTEGLAEFWSGPWNAEGDLMARDLLLNGLVPDLQDMDRYAGSYALYKLGQNAFEFLAERYGEERVVELLESEWKYRNFSTTFRKVYGIPLAEANEQWQQHLRERYFPQLAGERPAGTTATPVVTQGRLNFTPAIVPAGVMGPEPALSYVSLHSGYTTIQTASLTGRNEDLETVVTAGRSAAYETFHPLLSTIDVSRTGKLAFVAKAGASDVLYVADVRSGRREAEKRWSDLVVLASPTWAPDGRRVAFVGLSRAGYADLYVWDMQSDRLVRLTNDRYLEATPRWSPTGEEIVFASDRTPFGPEGARNLYVIDVAGRQIRPLTFGRWVDRDPDWSPDGSRLVFASDRSGTLDLYVIDREGNGFRASSFAAGTMHPRWVRAAGRDQIVFSAFENQSYEIYRVDVPRGAPETVALSVDPELPGWYWEDLLPEPGKYVQRDYERQFGLDFASGALAFAEDGSRGQGAQMFFSDLMGDHLIIAQVNAQQGRTNIFSGFTGALTYVNLKKRVNWGVGAYRLRSFFRSLLGAEFDRRGFGQEGIGVRNDFFEERWGATGLVSYPISKFQRVETEVSFERNNLTELPTDFNEIGDIFLRDAWLTIGSLGYVFDNTLWGAVGPVDGQRVNLTVSSVVNLSESGLESTDLLVDARKYFRTSLNTSYAVRARGRFASGDVPTFYYLGGPASLRGYPSYILNGTYTVLLNQEWRFPILRPNPYLTGVASLIGSGIWGGLFVDVGNAWTADGLYEDGDGALQELGSWPGLLGSYGASVRYPLAGPFILRLDYARRFALEDKRELFPDGRDSPHVSFFIGYNY
ncbi:MAG TPA: BamA/TamA family outer membrane protein [Gemmatimonadota bacterium]|nr:BamA/TamA family outer membrane protein [Gemmatimonadota bacterium]